MPSKKRQKGQAGFEYLITYGWALVAVATIVGVLVFSNAGGLNKTSCTSFMHLLCKGAGFEGNDFVLVLQNAAGQAITISPGTGIALNGSYGYAVIIYKGEEHYFEEVVIGAGEEFTVKILGGAETGEISITYTENSTGIERTEESHLKTEERQETAIESCGYTITEPGVYVLESNISIVGAECITIKADNVTLDCQGYTLSGDARTDHGIQALTIDNLLITNCHSTGFSKGLYLDDIGNSLFLNNHFNQNGIGIDIRNGTIRKNNKFANNEVKSNTNEGVLLENEIGKWNNNTICDNGTASSDPDIACYSTVLLEGTGNKLDVPHFQCSSIFEYTPCP
jgi:hypothetical protein